jgi:nitrogen fixation protein FixH
MSSMATSSNFELKGRHVLFAFLTFFGVIFAVNGYFLYSALGTHTGVVAHEPYRKGLQYNDRIAEDEKQSELGWAHVLAASTDGRLILNLKDKAGAPVVGLRIFGTLGRPSTSDFDRMIAFTERVPGTYVADTAVLADGAWISSIEAHEAGGARPIYRGRNRLWLKP